MIEITRRGFIAGVLALFVPLRPRRHHHGLYPSDALFPANNLWPAG
jgi:hypothetical protein